MTERPQSQLVNRSQIRGPFHSAGTNNGTLTDFPADPSANWVAGNIGGALNFDGVDDRVVTTDQNAFSPSDNDITVSLWAKVPVGAPAVGNSSCNSQGSSPVTKLQTDPEWEFQNDLNTRICFSMYTLAQGGHGFVWKNMTVNDGQWHHYVATVDYQNEVILYVDGAWADNETSFGSAMGNSTAPVTIGRRFNFANENPFTGQIDDVRIYNRALSAQEVAQLYYYGLSGGLGDVNNACANPTGVEGQMFYNADHTVMQYCNGEQWVGIGK